jgi:hypothetical protein
VILTEKYYWNKSTEDWKLAQKEEMKYNDPGLRIQYMITKPGDPAGQYPTGEPQYLHRPTHANPLNPVSYSDNSW